jgi:hypothetical protein
MKTLGWPYPFNERPWEEVRTFEASIWKPGQWGYYLVEIADDVMAGGRLAEDLAVMTSMHDLLVIRKPVPEHPTDLLRVYAPGSAKEPERDHVAIEFVSSGGHNTRIERPQAKAVRLFWRFVSEEMGITPLSTE